MRRSGRLALAAGATIAVLIGLGLTGGFGYATGGHSSAPSAASDQFAPPPETPGPLTIAQPGSATGCTDFQRYGYPSQDACVRMVTAIADGNAHVCDKRRWRTLFDFGSQLGCRRFVADRAATG
jgi:hypothetical protein